MRLPIARMVPAGNSTISGTPHSQAYNKYPQLVKCLCEPTEEEYYSCQGLLRGNLHVCFFLSPQTCIPQEVMRDWQNPVILYKGQLLESAQHLPVTSLYHPFPSTIVYLLSASEHLGQAWVQGELTLDLISALVTSLWITSVAALH